MPMRAHPTEIGAGPGASIELPGSVRRTRRDSLVIIPTYNEVENLGLLASMVFTNGPFDVLVVDDNSPDGTGAVADKLARRSRGRLAVLHRPSKLGLGTAYTNGFRYALHAGYDRIFQMDADFSHDPAVLPKLHKALDEVEVVLGSRYVSGGGTRNWSPWRQALSQAGSLYASLILGLPYHDLTGGFKGFRREALQSLDLDAIRSNGYAFQIEVTYRLHRQGFHIVEIPIIFEERRVGQSKMSMRIVMEALLVAWELRFSPSRRGEALPWPR